MGPHIHSLKRTYSLGTPDLFLVAAELLGRSCNNKNNGQALLKVPLQALVGQVCTLDTLVRASASALGGLEATTLRRDQSQGGHAVEMCDTRGPLQREVIFLKAVSKAHQELTTPPQHRHAPCSFSGIVRTRRLTKLRSERRPYAPHAVSAN